MAEHPHRPVHRPNPGEGELATPAETPELQTAAATQPLEPLRIAAPAPMNNAVLAVDQPGRQVTLAPPMDANTPDTSPGPRPPTTPVVAAPAALPRSQPF